MFHQVEEARARWERKRLEKEERGLVSDEELVDLDDDADVPARPARGRGSRGGRGTRGGKVPLVLCSQEARL